MAVGFNASGDYAKRTANLPNIQTFTMSGWVKWRDITPDAFSYPFGIEDADASSSDWALLGHEDNNDFEFSASGGTADLADISQDVWYYVFLRSTTTTGRLEAGYVTAAGSTFTKGASNGNNWTIARIGLGGDSYDEWANCVVAHVRVWDSELSDAQLLAERDSTTPVITSNLRADWPLADNTDNGDNSGNGYNLTFGGSLTTEDGPLASGTEYTQSATGTLTTAGVSAKITETTKAGVITVTGVISRAVTKTYLGALTITGDVFKETAQTFGGDLSLSKALSATKFAFKLLAGTLSSAGTIVRLAGIFPSGVLTASGVLIRDVFKALAGAINSAGALLTQSVIQRAFSGALSFTGVQVRQTEKMIAGTLTTARAITRAISKVVSGVLSSAGALDASLAGAIEQAVGGALSFAGAQTRQVNKSLSSVLAIAGGLVRSMALSMNGALMTVGSAIKAPLKLLTGAITSAGALDTQSVIQRVIGGVLSLAGTQYRLTSKSLAGVVSFVGAQTRSTLKVVVRVLTIAGAVVGELIADVIEQAVGGALSFAGALVKAPDINLAGILTAAGAIQKKTLKTITGGLGFTGTLPDLGIFALVQLTLKTRSFLLTLKSRSFELTIKDRSD